MKKLKILFIIWALSWVAAISSFSLASDINPQLSIDGNKNSLSADINFKSDLSPNLDKEFKKKLEIKSKEEIIKDLKKL